MARDRRWYISAIFLPPFSVRTKTICGYVYVNFKGVFTLFFFFWKIVKRMFLDC